MALIQSDFTQPGLVAQSGIRLRRATAVVGRTIELSAIEEAIEAARSGIAGISLEGEPGIGKSRLLLAAADVAAAHGFVTAAVSADEEIRGPFLLARGIYSSDSLRAGASERVVAALDRTLDVLSGLSDSAASGLAGLSSEDRLMRVIDQASMTLRMAALERPVALLLDDLQWADQDSLRLLRYVIRTQPSLPLFFAMAIRPEEATNASELVTLLADMDRMGVVKRMPVGRFRQSDTGELLRQALGGAAAPATIAAIQVQAEGVPFVIEEVARAYREAGLLQAVDGKWTLAPKAGRLVPSSVQTLVRRRAAHLNEETRGVLADAAVLGRTFRAADVCAIRTQLGQTGCTPAAVSEALTAAVDAGLLGAASERSGADFTFSHEQVYEFAATWLTPPRRRAVHAALVDLLAGADRIDPAALPALARHALAAGDVDRAARYSIDAAQAALAANAPEEALRLVDDALGVVAAIAPRVELLRIRDDAFDTLRRVDDRLEGLTELAALAEAARDEALLAEVMLRRAAALRLDEQHDMAAELARRVRGGARERGDERQEQAACVELGQDLLRANVGDGYAPTPLEADFDGAEDAYKCAAEIAERLDDKRALAGIWRELGVISTARARAWFIDQYRLGAHIPILRHVAAGGRPEDMMISMPVYPMVLESMERFQRALELYESLDDRRGAMSTIIAMAYMSWAPDVHFGASPARRIEEIRGLASRMRGLSVESERASAEAQMVYGVHVFCRSKVVPDLALERGREAYALARTIGDRELEFLAADGTAWAYLELGDTTEASRWLDRAATAATSAPTQARARRLELSRGLCAAGSGNADGLRSHLEQALQLSAGQDRRAARCEILAIYATEAARLGRERVADDPSRAELVELAEARGAEALRIAAELPGHPLWGAQAQAALADVALTRGDDARALELARAALVARQAAQREDPHFEVLVPAARVILALGSPEEQAAVRDELQLLQALIGQRTQDGDVRARWFQGPIGRSIADLAGPFEPPAPTEAATEHGHGPTLDADEQRLLALLIEGRTNAEIAQEVGGTPASVAQRLAEMYARIGATSRAEATVMAVSGLV